MSWKSSSGRDEGPESYVFGDVVRMVGRGLFGRRRDPSSSEQQQQPSGTVAQQLQATKQQQSNLSELSQEPPVGALCSGAGGGSQAPHRGVGSKGTGNTDNNRSDEGLSNSSHGRRSARAARAVTATTVLATTTATYPAAATTTAAVDTAAGTTATHPTAVTTDNTPNEIETEACCAQEGLAYAAMWRDLETLEAELKSASKAAAAAATPFANEHRNGSTAASSADNATDADATAAVGAIPVVTLPVSPPTKLEPHAAEAEMDSSKGIPFESTTSATFASSTTTKHSAMPLEGACWPDPDPVLVPCQPDAAAVDDISGTRSRSPSRKDNFVRVDDVTRMNACAVERIFHVRSTDDVKHVLGLARARGQRVSMRGAKHSMGGHTMCSGGFVLDMKYLNHIAVDAAARRVTVGPGCLWSDLIYELNAHGLSPRTMQSYSTFSVGGAISVNAHGITTDYCCAESVLSLTVVKWDGSEVVCRRDAPGEAGELFGLVIGGYGMFGVIVDITMSVVPNTLVRMETISCSVAEFARIFRSLCAAPDVEIKLGRMDITTYKNCQLFVFRRQSRPGVCTVSSLPLEPFAMSKSSQLMYKWVLPHAASLRASIERATGRAVDMGTKDDRNTLMYESAEPLAQLYSPLYELDDTFVLQEFFVPESEFLRWVEGARAVVTAKYTHTTLLNTTVRFVEADNDTVLAYARAAGGCFAFVLYYRISRSVEGDAELESIHTALTDLTLGLGGTFYLPYRHHYSKAQLRAAYPAMGEFWERKLHYDPHGLFDSTWSAVYGADYIEEAGGFAPPITLPTEAETMAVNLAAPAAAAPAAAAAAAVPAAPAATPAFSASSSLSAAPRGFRDAAEQSHVEEVHNVRAVRFVSERRNDSYRRLMGDPALRVQFFSGFLHKIFKVAHPDSVAKAVAKATWDPDNRTDADIYDDVREQLQQSSTGPTTQLGNLWRGLRQLRAQRTELTRETGAILARLGRLGSVHDYASVGDHGKLVLAFRDTFGMRGTSYVVNDDPGNDMRAVLERGLSQPVGQFIRIDYKDPRKIALPDGSVDLLTLNMGLHHFPQSCIAKFLSEVARVLRPGALFILREHNASTELLPMLDLAHSIFNAVSGVSGRAERNEIRAFRPILEWRRIVEAAGFEDTMLYEMEAGDPTLDEMMCFSKGNLNDFVPRAEAQLARPKDQQQQRQQQEQGSAAATSPSAAAVATTADVPTASASIDGGVADSQSARSVAAINAMIKRVAVLTEGVPAALMELLRAIAEGSISAVEGLRESVAQVLASLGLTEGQQHAGIQLADRVLAPIMELFVEIRPYLDAAKLKDTSNGIELVPHEAFLLIEALLLKGERGEASANELLAIAAITDLQRLLAPADSTTTQGPGVTLELHSATTVAAAAAADGSRGVSSSGSAVANGGGGGANICVAPQRLVSGDSAEKGVVGTTLINVGGTAAAVDESVVCRLLERVLKALPDLSRRDALLRAGFGQRAQTMLNAELGDQPLSAARVTRALMPYLDPATWLDLEGPLEEVVCNPDAHPFSFTALTKDHDGPWWRAAMALLGSPKVKIRRSAQMMASMVGLSSIVHMWQVSQRARAARPSGADNACTAASPLPASVEAEAAAAQGVDDARAAAPAPVSLSTPASSEPALAPAPMRLPPPAERGFGDVAERLLSSATLLAREKWGIAGTVDEAALEALVRCLRLTGIIGATEPQPEYTFYKLSEWMQVEFVELFGEFMHHTPWFRFPFMPLLRVYFGVLMGEFSAVRERHGLGRALFSEAFVTDAVPGAAMALLFAQLQLLALPLRLVLGDDYTTDNLRNQKEELVVLRRQNDEGGERQHLPAFSWKMLGFDCTVRPLVSGLELVTVPSLGSFTSVMLALADLPPETLRILLISGHSKVQVRVTIASSCGTEDALTWLRGLEGCQVVLKFRLPRTSARGASPPSTSVAVVVKVPFLLKTLQAMQEREGMEVYQVYDFWG